MSDKLVSIFGKEGSEFFFEEILSDDNKDWSEEFLGKTTKDSLPIVNFNGIDIVIENQPGSVREGVEENGHKYKVKFSVPYGYIANTVGRDNEEIDVFLGDDELSEFAYVVRQRIEGFPDEDKIFLGFPSVAVVKKVFLEHVDNPDLLGGILEIPFEEFKKMVDSGIS